MQSSRHDKVFVSVTRCVCVALDTFQQHVFLDLHAVNPAHIESANAYFGLVLVPWGPLWKVELPGKSAGQEEYKSGTRAIKLLNQLGDLGLYLSLIHI